MPPAVVAAIAAVATVAVKVFVASKLLAAILLVAISIASSMLMKKPSRSYNQGQEIRLKLDPAMPRQVALGYTGTGGSLIWAFTYTDNYKKPNRYLVRIIQISDLPINSLVVVNEGKDQLSFSGDFYTGFAACDQHKTKKYATAMWMRVYKGSSTPTADASLISWSGGQWTANHKGTNCAYVILKYDNDPDAFPSGEPQLLFQVEGAKLYDERYDTTVGGSGAQRLNDPSTWVYSKNASVITANVLRGLFSAGVLLYGAQAETRDLDVNMLFSAHNTCDQAVGSVGGSVARYTAGLMATSSDSTAVALLDLQASFDGRILDRGGAITLRPGAAHTPVFALTDDDVVWSEQKSWQPRSSLSEITNCITGTYPDETEGFQEKPFPPIRNAAWEAEDGGERFTTNIAFRAVTTSSQAQRITKRVGDSSRYQGTVAFALGIWALEIEQGDWFTMSSSRWGFSTKYFEVATADIIMGETLMIAITGREVSPSFSSWDYAVDERPRTDTQWTSPVYDLVLPDFTVSQYHLLDTASYSEVFGLDVQLYNIPDGFSAKQVEIQIAYTSDLASPWVAGLVAAANQTFTIAPLKPATNYSVRVRATDGQRYTEYSSWVNVVTASSTNPLAVDIAALEADILAANNTLITVQGDVVAAEAAIAQAQADILAAEGDIATLYTTTGTQGALISSNATAITTLQGNLATLQTKVLAGNPNLIRNGGFEDGLIGWTQTGVWARSNPVDSIYGVHAYCQPSLNGGSWPTTPILASDLIKVTAGLQYTFSADVRTNITSGLPRIDVIWYAGDGTTVVLDDNNFAIPLGREFYPTGPGREVNFATYTAPVGAVYVRCRFYVSSPVGTHIAVRQLKLEIGDKVTAYTPEASVVETFTALASAEGDIATLEIDLATTNANVTLNASAISTANADIAQLEIDLGVTDANVAINASAISTTNTNVATLEQRVTAGNPNLLLNGGFEQGLGAWAGFPGTGAWNPQGGAWFFWNGNGWGPQVAIQNQTAIRTIDSSLFAVYPNTQYTISADLQCFATSSSAHIYVDIMYVKADFSMATGGDSGQNMQSASFDFSSSNARRAATAFTSTAPADAVWAQARVVINPNGATITSAGARQIKVEKGSAWTPYSSEASITSSAIAITALEGDITTAFARVALTLDVSGNITGYEINNNGTTSQFIVRADQFKIANSTGTPFEVSGSQVRMKDVKIGTLQVDDLAISTGKLANYAAAQPASAYTAAAIGISAGTTTVIQTAIITSTGAPIYIIGMASLALVDVGGGGGITILIKRNGTIVYTRPGSYIFDAFGNASSTDNGACAVVDQPGAGTWTYTLEIQTTVMSGSAAGRSLMLLETKK